MSIRVRAARWSGRPRSRANRGAERRHLGGRVIAHELGHTFGLPHAKCDPTAAATRWGATLSSTETLTTRWGAASVTSARRAKLDLGLDQADRQAGCQRRLHTRSARDTFDSSSGLRRDEPPVDQYWIEDRSKPGAERSRRARWQAPGVILHLSARPGPARWGLPPTSRGNPPHQKFRRSAGRPRASPRRTGSPIPVRSG